MVRLEFCRAGAGDVRVVELLIPVGMMASAK